MFGKKQSEPTIEWVTDTPGLAEMYPMIPARKAIPEWFRKSDPKIDMGVAHGHGPSEEPATPLPGARTEIPTIRACPGVVDVLRAGFLLRAWTDIQIITPQPARGDSTDQYRASTAFGPNEKGGQISAFNPALNQLLPLWPGEYGFALKFDSPWLCKTPPGWSLLYLPISYAEKTPYRIVPGIIDTDYMHVVNLLLMWDHYGSYTIEAGTPLCWLLPVKRDGFQMNADVSYNPDRTRILRSFGKGGPGEWGSRLVHGAYVKARMKRAQESSSDGF